MLKNKKTVYFCQECGYESAKWMGQCPACKAWNTFVEETVSSKKTASSGVKVLQKMTEPAIDLGICLAIISSAKDIVIPDSVMVFGEIGLSGEVRAVSMAGQRVQEAKKLGFETVILPEVNRAATESMKGIRMIYVAGIRDAISYIMR